MDIKKIKDRVERFQKTRESLVSQIKKKEKILRELVEYDENCS